MAIGKIAEKSQSVADGINYILASGRYEKDFEKKKPEIIMSNFFTNTYDTDVLAKEFHNVSSINARCKNPEMKFSISFDKNENLSEEIQLEFTKNVIKEMGVNDENYQYLVVSHSDQPHPHHHILINRVGLDSTVLSNSFSKAKLELAIDKTEKLMGLSNDLAETRRYVYDPSQINSYRVQSENFKKNQKQIKPIREKSQTLQEKKQYMQTQIILVIRENRITNPYDLEKELKKKNIGFKFTMDKQNKKVLGTSFEYQKLALKGSAINLKAIILEREFSQNKVLNYKNVESTNNLVEETPIVESDKNMLQNFLESGNNAPAEIENRKKKKYIDDSYGFDIGW